MAFARMQGVGRSDGDELSVDVPLVAAAGGKRRDGDERALIRAARSGSRPAAEELAARYWDDAYRAAYLILRDAAAAEDVAQEALLAALAKLSRFRSSRPFGPWLHRIAVNRALDWRRSYRRRREIPGEGNAAVGDPGDDSLTPELTQALEELSVEDRAIVVLRHLWDYRASEIGRMLGVSASTVRTRLQRALETLRASLQQDEEER